MPECKKKKISEIQIWFYCTRFGIKWDECKFINKQKKNALSAIVANGL
jgi:hypothetical protein